jgi:hypothetical protein
MSDGAPSAPRWPLVLAWLLMPVLGMGAVLMGSAPGDLAPVALACGPALVVATWHREGRPWRTWGALAALLIGCEAAAQAIGQPHGLLPAQRVVEALVAGGIVAVQAVLSARHVDRVWDELLHDTRLPPLRRLSAMARMVAFGVVPLSIVAGAGMAGLHVILGGLVPDGVLRLDLHGLTMMLATHALASSLSVLVLVPLLRLDRWPLPGWRLVLGLVLAGPALALVFAQWPDALVVLPAYVFIAGWLGGLSAASLAVTVSTVVLVNLGHQQGGASPFDGPDGYTVLLATVMRLAVVGLLGMVWNEPRHRTRAAREGRAGRDVRSGALTYRNLMALEWQLARTGYGRGARASRPVLWLHIDMPVNRPPGSRSALSPLSLAGEVPASTSSGADPGLELLVAGPIGRLTATPTRSTDDLSALSGVPVAQGQADGLDSTLPSPRLPALMQALARGLRGNDAVVPIAGEALIVLVDDIDRSVVGNLVNRLDVLLLREGRSHLAPADIRQAALVDAGAATVLLTSARYLSIDL